MAAITEVRSPADWCGDEIAGRRDWRMSLSDVHRAEVLSALAAAEASRAQAATAQADAAATRSPSGSISRGDFPLPTLGPELERSAREVAGGCGFTLLQGLPVAALTERQCEIVALGIACYFGGIVGQGPHAAPLLHVRDEGADPARPTSRSYQHSERLGFHADPTDVVALLCIRPAKSGGLSSIVSSVAVHNELVRTRPDLARALYEPWWFDRRSGDGPDSFVQRPVYRIEAGGELVTYYGPDYIRSARRGAHVPPLTPVQLAAMEVLDRLTNDPRFVLTMDLRAGDMQFLNNRVILHGRTAYEDHLEPERRRDLIRLWLTAG